MGEEERDRLLTMLLSQQDASDAAAAEPEPEPDAAATEPEEPEEPEPDASGLEGTAVV